MSVRTYDPKSPEIFDKGLCAAQCGKVYDTICRLCNLAYCAEHLKPGTHVCDSKAGHLEPAPEEIEEGVVMLTALPSDWDASLKGCFAQHPESREVCQLRSDGHDLHQRAHPNGVDLEMWRAQNGAAPNGAEKPSVIPIPLDVRSLRQLHAADMKWAMERNADLILALRHEVFGNEPCGPDCTPGGWRKCTGCDKRAKDALQSRE